MVAPSLSFLAAISPTFKFISWFLLPPLSNCCCTPFVLHLYLIHNMPIQQTHSRRKNVSTIIRRRTDRPVVSSQAASPTLGSPALNARLNFRQSSSSQPPSSTSASPAPSLVSEYGQDPSHSTVQWDLPTSIPPAQQPAPHRNRSSQPSVCFLSLVLLLFPVAHFQHIRQNQ